MATFFRVSLLAVALFASAACQAQASAVTLRSTLLGQLHASHDKAGWFTPLNAAVAGLTLEQAEAVPVNAKGRHDANENHSVAALANHLAFWNDRVLRQLQGEKVGEFKGSNDETFTKLDQKGWTELVARLDATMRGIEQYTETASDADLAKHAETLANLAAHNAYHTGQILYVRKLEGTWNPANGVK